MSAVFRPSPPWLVQGNLVELDFFEIVLQVHQSLEALGVHNLHCIIVDPCETQSHVHEIVFLELHQPLRNVVSHFLGK